MNNKKCASLSSFIMALSFSIYMAIGCGCTCSSSGSQDRKRLRESISIDMSHLDLFVIHNKEDSHIYIIAKIKEHDDYRKFSIPFVIRGVSFFPQSQMMLNGPRKNEGNRRVEHFYLHGLDSVSMRYGEDGCFEIGPSSLSELKMKRNIEFIHKYGRNYKTDSIVPIWRSNYEYDACPEEVCLFDVGGEIRRIEKFVWDEAPFH